jgi:23S rRNA (guanosine2251-2'-O)-methyltransferase
MERSKLPSSNKPPSSNDRLPYRATAGAAAYEQISPLPVCVLLENVRSLYNVGAFFRTADAVALEKLYLAGITGYPPQNMITKTALGAEETVPWQRLASAVEAIRERRAAGCEIAAIETSAHAVDLFDWQPRFPVCVLFGHETDGLTPEAASLADTHVRIPMLGRKHSLNVASAGSVVLYELLRKYRSLARP